jgi:AMP-binding enzyme
VEFGINAGDGIGMDLRTRRVYTPRQAMTEHILMLAGRVGYGAALIDAGAAELGKAFVVSWPQLVRMVRAAAHGLSRRGLQEGDTAAIFVQDAVSHVLAVHAVRAAGANAAPVRPPLARADIGAPVGPDQAVADIAAQLKQGQARLLITSAGLAELAIQAAERSLVRQVFAFGEAEGTTPFGPLLHTARHGQHPTDGSSSTDVHNGHDGRTNLNGSRAVAHARDLDGPGLDGRGQNRLELNGFELNGFELDEFEPDGLGLGGPAPRLGRRDVVVAAPPCGGPDVYTSLLDLALGAGATTVAAPLPLVAAAVGAYKGTAAIVPHGTDVPGLPEGRIFTVG